MPFSFRATYTTAILAGTIALLACAHAQQAARTALDVAREACDVFLGAQPAEERQLGMSLDQCADHLLAGQQRVLAARRTRPVVEP